MTIVIEEGVIAIKPFEYKYREDITSIELPTTLKRIGEHAFIFNKNLKVVVLPDGIERIDSCAFSGCKAFIYVPKSIKYIGGSAFSKDCVVFFEGKRDDFEGFYRSTDISNYPDSYYRGGSMGSDFMEEFFYEEGCEIYYEKTLEEFMLYVKNHS